MGLFNFKKDNNLLGRVLFGQLGNNTIVWTDSKAENYIEEFYSKNTNLYTVIRYVVDAVNKIDIVVRDKNGEIVEEGALYDWINHPNKAQTWDSFAGESIAFKLVTGNMYLYFPLLGGDAPFIESYVMPSQYMAIKFGDWMKPVKGYEIKVAGGFNKTFDPEEVLHIKEVNLSYKDNAMFYGMSRLSPGSKTVDTNQEAQTAAASRFKNRGAAALATIKGTSKADTGLKEAAQLERALKKKLSGSGNEGAIAFTGRDVDIHRLDISAVDLGIFEGKRMTLHDLCALYKVPPVLVDPEAQNTYNNVREAKKSLYVDAAIPEVRVLLQSINSFINRIRDERGRNYFDGQYLDFDTSGIEVLQTDYESMAKWVNESPFTVNEVRAMFGKPEINTPEGEMLWVLVKKSPFTDITVDEMLKDIKDYK